MTPRIRFAIATIFILAFVATAPIVLLLTSGYRVDWKNHRVRKTGSIHVETNPVGATVAIDGVAQGKYTPNTYTRLLPETYRVTVSHDGYFPWEKRLPVQSGTTTFAVGLTLYRDMLPRLALQRESVAAAWSPDGTDVALLTKDGAWLELLVMQDDHEPVLLARFSAATYAAPALEWSPNGRSVLFTGIAGKQTHAMVYVPGTSAAAKNLHESVPSGAFATHWLGDNAIGVVSAGAAYRVDPVTGIASIVRQGSGILDIGADRRGTYVLRRVAVASESTVAVERIEQDRTTPLTSLPDGNYRFLEGSERTLLVADRHRGKLYRIDGSNGDTVAYDASFAAWDADGGRVLAWNDFEISVIGTDGSSALLTRLGTPIEGCAWSPDGNAVVYATAEGISLVELDSRDHRNTFDLVKFSRVGPFAVDRTAKLLRFVGDVGNQHGVYDREL